ncbi:hypothetical protein Mucpa_4630 [Mucilaginibacter paludis DSM 18603]|uniref:Uncharacterized protein n=1 Tax=Mucilaginibacter paludis DSM 18603 TaxID=714943 RepID=H1Y8V2_9SPHI|nr:hypothetical protein Mucpa_4630 [Mucilaginibacter paludis DSM 18603]
MSRCMEVNKMGLKEVDNLDVELGFINLKRC